MRHKGYQTRTWVGLNGPVTVRRARFRCGKTQAFEYPLDAVLDLPPHEVTVSLARRALRLSTHMSFETLQEELQYQHEVRVSDTVLDRLMQAAGGVAEADRAARAAALAALPEGVAREQRVGCEAPLARPKRLYVSCDGVMYPTRGRQEENGRKRLVFQEMKCGTVFWREGDSASSWHKNVMASRDDADRFGLSLWELAVRCGMSQADEVIFISDGGTWCDTVAKRHFHDATRILDWYHLSEHVWTAARVLHSDEGAARRWVSRCHALLAEWSGIGLLRYLRRSRRARAGGATGETLGPDVEALDALIGYLEPRLPITDYVDYRRKGYVIGSGLMESSCKQLVGARLKGSGRQWSEAGALAMTALIAQRLNHQWDAFWSSRPLHRAA